MGGFTRPRDLRVTNWMPGGRYIAKNKPYEDPPTAAYKPTTVFLIQSKYFVKHGLGRMNTPVFIVDYCPAGHFKRYLRQINSGYAPSALLESMDNACWPGVAENVRLKRTKWWDSEEDPKNVRMEALYGPEEAQSSNEPQQPVIEEEMEYESDDDDLQVDLARVAKARDERKQKIKEMKMSGASQTTIANFTSIPWDPTKHMFNLKVAGPSPKLTREQLQYVTDKEKLRMFSQWISHNPTTRPSVTETSEKFDQNFLNPDFVDTTLAGTVYQYRQQYIPTLEETPFWIPVLAVTFPTRAIARTVARLSKALPRGIPYYSSLVAEDLKCRYSQPSRLLNLRLTRMRRLAIQTAERLAGYFGGFPGLRYDPKKPGRGVKGTLLDSPPTPEQKRVVALVGDWYQRASDEVAGYVEEGRTPIGAGLMDERGNALDPNLAFDEDDSGDLDVNPTEDDQEDSESDDDDGESDARD